jgi:ribonuclease HII
MLEFQRIEPGATPTYEIGIDEVGRGCLFGPVVAGAVVLPSVESIERDWATWSQIKDSKKLTEKKRRSLCSFLKERCVYGIGWVQATEIDQMNILQATLKAMATALDECLRHPSFPVGPKKAMVSIDGTHFKKGYLPPGDEESWRLETRCFTSGDQTYLAIAAASILAKDTRDQRMVQWVQECPELTRYAIEKNKGYGTVAHMKALRTFGRMPDHRRSFRPCAEENLGALNASQIQNPLVEVEGQESEERVDH